MKFMKIKTITIAVLLTSTCLLLANLLFSFDLYKDEIVKVGWYNSFGENKMISVFPVHLLLSSPFTVCFYFFLTFFLVKVITHVNKHVGWIALTLWGISFVSILLEIFFNLYIVSAFDGDEMYRSFEVFWRTIGRSDYPLMWFLLSSDVLNGLYYLYHYSYLMACFAFAVVFALLVRKDKVFGVTGMVVMAVSFLMKLFSLPYGYVNNLCWIVLCAVVLWRLHKSSPDKPFMLQ